MKPNSLMQLNRIAVVLTIVAVLGGNDSGADAASDDESALELGRKVLAVREAIQNPRGPNAMQAITDLGGDQRYYVMVRGWLSYQLAGDMSILRAATGHTREKVGERIDFLEKAIRAIDLE